MKKRAMKKWIPVASTYCDDCKLLVISPDIDGYKYARCKYCNKVWLHDSLTKSDQTIVKDATFMRVRRTMLKQD